MNATAPTVSILVPVFNAAEFVAETLGSAIAQGPDIEILAIDDGSTDDSWPVLQQYAPRVQSTRQSNRGASASRNSLLAKARGVWLCFLDADDVMLPGAIDRALDVAARSGADVICAGWRPLKLDTDGAWRAGEGMRVDAPSGADPALAVFDGWWLPPGAVLVRKSWAERVGGFRLDLPVIQDARFLFDLARAGATFAATGKTGLSYRERAGVSLSRRDSGAFWRDCLLNTEQVEAGYRAAGQPTQAVRKSLLSGFELAARSLGAIDAGAARRALAGARRQVGGDLHVSRWMRVALSARPFVGARLACRLSARLARSPVA